MQEHRSETSQGDQLWCCGNPDSTVDAQVWDGVNGECIEQELISSSLSEYGNNRVQEIVSGTPYPVSNRERLGEPSDLPAIPFRLLGIEKSF